MEPFDENQKVTPLPCSIKHYFHTNCIETWMKRQTVCPFCRQEINVKELKSFNKKVDKLLKQEEQNVEDSPVKLDSEDKDKLV